MSFLDIYEYGIMSHICKHLSISDIRSLSIITKWNKENMKIFIEERKKENSIILLQFRIREFIKYKRILYNLKDFDNYIGDDYENDISTYIRTYIPKIHKQLRKNSTELKTELCLIIHLGISKYIDLGHYYYQEYCNYLELNKQYNKWFFVLDCNIYENYFI